MEAAKEVKQDLQKTCVSPWATIGYAENYLLVLHARR